MTRNDKSKSSSSKSGDKKKSSEKLKAKQAKKDLKKSAGKSSSSNASSPWYAEGLRFTCTQCGDCCSGEPGYVWVDESEIAAMAVELKMDVEAFERKFVREVGLDKSLVEYPDGDCILLDPKTRKCTVYGSRPIQCRTWPFWDSNLEKRKAWKETCDVCPGVGKGKLYTLEEIESARQEKSV